MILCKERTKNMSLGEGGEMKFQKAISPLISRKKGTNVRRSQAMVTWKK